MASLNGYTDIVFLDDRVVSKSVIGKLADIERLRGIYDTAIVALGNNENRRKYHELLKQFNYRIPILIHPTSYISPDACISPGCIIREHAVVSRFSTLHESVIINIGVLIDHHCEIGEYTMILPGAVVRNCVKLKQMSWIKANDVIE